MDKHKVAVKYVNLMDRVPDLSQNTLVPAGFGIQRVDKPDPDPVFTRGGRVGNAWWDFDDRSLADLVGTGLQGE